MEPVVFGRRRRGGLFLLSWLLLAAVGGWQSIQAADESLKGDAQEIDDLKVTPLELDAKLVLPCLLWADSKGSAFFVFDQNGVLKRVSYPDFKVEATKDFERKCAWLARSAEGLLVTVPDKDEVWVLDPQKLDSKASIPVPGLQRAVSAPDLSLGVASGKGMMFVLDLKKGKAVRYLSPSPQIAFDDPVMTPDGKYLFTRGALEQMFRFQNVNGKFRAEEASPRIAQGAIAAGIQVSPESKLVCLPCGGGNYGAKPPYSTFVYDMKTFKKAEFTLEQGAYPQAVGFDPVGGYIFAQNAESPFILFSYTGIKKKQYKFGRDASVRQYLVHPEGNKVLMLTADKIYSIEVPPKKK